MGGGLKVSRDIALEVSYSMIGVQNLLQCGAHADHSLRSRRKPHEWTNILFQTFFCDPMCHGRTDPFMPAGCRRCCATAGGLPASTAPEIQSKVFPSPMVHV